MYEPPEALLRERERFALRLIDVFERGALNFEQFAYNVTLDLVMTDERAIASCIDRMSPELLQMYWGWLREELEPVDFMPSADPFVVNKRDEAMCAKRQRELRPVYIRLHELIGKAANSVTDQSSEVGKRQIDFCVVGRRAHKLRKADRDTMRGPSDEPGGFKIIRVLDEIRWMDGGGAELLIVPGDRRLDGSPEMLELLKCKIQFYLDQINTDGFQAVFKHPPAEKVVIVLIYEEPLHPTVVEYVESAKPWVAQNNATLILRSAAEDSED